MKARSKYGSVYPGIRPAPKVAPVAAASTAVMKLPHERDEVLDEGGGQVESERVSQAYCDVRRGLPDTDRGAEVNKTYQKQKTPKS